MNILKTIGLSALVAAIVVFLSLRLVGDTTLGAIGKTRFPNSGLAARSLTASTSTNPTVGADGTLTVTGATTLSGAVTHQGITTLTGETTLGNCGTATWNPGNLAATSTLSGAATTTDIAVAGAAMGDTCFGSLDSATSSAATFHCNISGNATATLTLINTGYNTALDLVTGTAKVCYFD